MRAIYDSERTEFWGWQVECQYLGEHGWTVDAVYLTAWEAEHQKEKIEAEGEMVGRIVRMKLMVVESAIMGG
jgi:hypothetical protein